MKQIEFPQDMQGAKSDGVVSGARLADEVFGDDANACGLPAFAYLWRRFGPPIACCDPHKSLVSYFLTTADDDVVLWVEPSASPLRLGFGYMSRVKHGREDWLDDEPWQSGTPVAQRLNRAVRDAIRELLRPVYVRDVPINIIGRMSDDDAERWGYSADISKYAGVGVPTNVMDELLRKADE